MRIEIKDARLESERDPLNNAASVRSTDTLKLWKVLTSMHIFVVFELVVSPLVVPPGLA